MKMNHRPFRHACAVTLLALLPFLAPALSTSAQREHLTPEEIELVRENQALDARMGVFVKAAERRLRAVSDPQAASVKPEKETENLGALEGTRTQLLSDIAGILDEAITNIEDASIHSEKSPLIPKALRKLAEGCNRLLPQLTALRQTVEDERERDSLERSIESAQQIVDAASKLPPEVKKQN